MDPFSRFIYTDLMHFELCPACGEVIDFCQGHGEFGDPEGRQVLEQHDAGDHSSCNPRGCEEVT